MQEKLFTRDVRMLLAAAFFYSSSPMLIAPLVAGFAQSMGMSAALAGMMTGIMYLGSLCCRPFFGRLADRRAKSTLMKSGLVVMAASVLLTTVSVSGWMILTARILNGIGYCLCSISISAWIAALFPRNRVGTGMGCYGMINALANAVAPMCALQLAAAYSCRVSFLASFLCLAAAFVLVCQVRSKGAAGRKASRPGKFRLVCRPSVPFAGIIMCFTIPFYATTAFVTEYMTARGWSAPASLYFLVYSAALLLLRLALKDAFDRLPFRRFYRCSLLSGLAACLLLAMGHGLAACCLAGIAMAGGYGIMSSECQSCAILAADPSQSGLASSTFFIGIDLGLLLGPTIGGEVIDGLGMGLLYPCLAAVLLGSLLIYVPMRRKLGSLH